MKKPFVHALAAFFMLLWCANAHADVIKGVVKDAAGVPIPGAAVMVQGTTQGVSTDLDGNFTIDVADAPHKALEITCIGMQTQLLKIGSKTVDSKVDFRHSGFEKGASGRPFQR